MKLAELADAAMLPLRNLTVFFALLMFWALLWLVAMAGILGIWLAILIIPAMFRFMSNLVETVGRGLKPVPPGLEFFRWIGDSWSLFPAVFVILLGWVSYDIYLKFGATPMTLLLLVAGLLYPAMLGVLSVTHSPLQALNPLALTRMIRCIGPSYLIAPLYLAVLVYASSLLLPLPAALQLLLQLLMIFSLHAVIGALLAPHAVFDDVYLPELLTPADAEIEGDIEKARADVLAHAYGFISRGNRDGGIQHIMEWINNDPDEVGAWRWYFEHMLQWQNPEPALVFAQHYIHDLFRHGDNVAALKLILRCRLSNAAFKPAWEDLSTAIAAAESSGNSELAAVLKRR